MQRHEKPGRSRNSGGGTLLETEVDRPRETPGVEKTDVASTVPQRGTVRVGRTSLMSPLLFSNLRTKDDVKIGTHGNTTGG